MPYPNEHSARLQDPAKFDPKSFRRTEGGTLYGSIKVPASISIIWGKLKGKSKPSDPPIAQSLRFPIKSWTADAAKKWLKDNKVKYQTFEPASGEGKKAENETTYNCECIECGHRLTSKNHCRDLKCPKCGGQMRRVERPGPGQKSDDTDFDQHDYQSDLTVRAFQAMPGTINDEKRSVEAVLATEDRVSVVDLGRWQVVDEILLMSGLKVSDHGQVPMLDSHNRSSVRSIMGSIREIRVQGSRLLGKKVFSESRETEHAWTLTKEGHLNDNSIGYRIQKSVIVERGQKQEIEGRMFTASRSKDLRVVTKWELREASILAIGADAKAKNRESPPLSADYDMNKNDNSNIGSIKMEKFKLWLLERGLDYDTLNEEQRVALEVDFKAQQDPAQRSPDPAKPDDSPPAAKPPSEGKRDDVDPQKIAQDAIDAERQRVAKIRELAGEDVAANVVEDCIRSGKSIDESTTIFLDHIRRNRPHVGSAPAIHIHESTVTRQAIVDALLLRSGQEDHFADDEAHGDERAEVAKRIRDCSLLDVCRHALFMDGVTIPAGREDLIRAAFSTVSLSNVLANVLTKSLLKGYAATPETWPKWCQVGNLPDFKAKTAARLADMGDLIEVPADGEVKYGSLEDEGESYSLATYAKNVAISRTHIINDDLGALTKVPRGMGVKAKRKVGDLVYTHLLANGNMSDGVALFASGHSNLNTSAALSMANLKVAAIALAKQTDKDSKPINIPARFLLVPPDLKYTGAEITKSILLIAAGSTDNVQGARNVLIDEDIEVVSEARMSNASFTGYSTTSWYLIGDPAMCDTIEVGFLNGRQEPTIEQFNPGPDRMGVTYRVSHDVGCKAVDYRGMQKNTA